VFVSPCMAAGLQGTRLPQRVMAGRNPVSFHILVCVYLANPMNPGIIRLSQQIHCLAAEPFASPTLQR
jgi:hypothetical protein